jgi:hypothetical protein
MKKAMGILIIFLLVVLSGCYYDREEELYGSGTCSTANVNFSGTVNSILSNYGCMGCHSGSSPSGGISLRGHANVKLKITDGRLWGAINHSPGFSPMPQGGNKMSSCDINKLKAWIDAGALNN